MTRFTKRPIYNHNSIMKNIKLTSKVILAIFVAIILVGAIILATLYTVVKFTVEPVRAENEKIKTELTEAKQPTQLELYIEKRDTLREERKEIQSEIDELVELKKEKTEKTNQYNEKISEIVGVK